MGTAELAFEYIETDLKQLGLDYVDLLLIHAPGGGTLSDPGCGGPCKTAADRQATYKGLERALAAKMTRSIGVSNFKTEHIKEILVALLEISEAEIDVVQRIEKGNDSFAKIYIYINP